MLTGTDGQDLLVRGQLLLQILRDIFYQNPENQTTAGDA